MNSGEVLDLFIHIGNGVIMRQLVFGFMAIALVACPGCGNGLPQVSGTVTLDDQPLANALVTFEPVDGRPSYARTDEDGFYRLIYTDDKTGGTLGTNQVSITTKASGDPDAGTASSPEKLPAIYNTKTELSEEVVAGSQTINFDLKSEGVIVDNNDG
ncbi:MAG: carboxypeptidase-like regulatory domain-containing protein [Planctomycetales bacterium]